jgi:hypothetical protein
VSAYLKPFLTFAPDSFIYAFASAQLYDSLIRFQ